MTDVARERYTRLMDEIDGLEEQLAQLERDLAAEGQQDGSERGARHAERDALRQHLTDQYAELARLTNGCRRPHS